MLHDFALEVSWAIGWTAGAVVGAAAAVTDVGQTLIGIALLDLLGGWL